MRRTFAVLALPVTLLAVAGVMVGSFDSVPAGAAVPAVTASGSPSANLRRVETGAALAVTQTNWVETDDGSVIVPQNPPGNSKR